MNMVDDLALAICRITYDYKEEGLEYELYSEEENGVIVWYTRILFTDSVNIAQCIKVGGDILEAQKGRDRIVSILKENNINNNDTIPIIYTLSGLVNPVIAIGSKKRTSSWIDVNDNFKVKRYHQLNLIPYDFTVFYPTKWK